MTHDLSSECVADGLEIDQVDFMQCRYLLDLVAEFGESFRGDDARSADGDVDIGVRFGGALGPGTEPNDLNVGAQQTTRQIGYFTSDLSRASDEFLGQHEPSVSVLMMLSTWLWRGRAGDVYPQGVGTVASPLSRTYNAPALFNGSFNFLEKSEPQ